MTNFGLKPLSKRTVLVTRTTEGNKVERKKLEQLGARVIELSTIEIAPPSSWKKLDHAIEKLAEFDWIVFTSAKGVALFFERCVRKGKKQFCESLKGKNKLYWPKFACVGPSTRLALESLGFSCALEPDEFLTEQLGRELAKFITPTHNQVLLARAEEANRNINETLKESGAKIFEAPVYRTIAIRRKRMLSRTKLEKVTDVTLTSPSTVSGLLGAVTASVILSQSIRVHCIGPVTAKVAKEKGLRVSSVATNHTIDGLIESMISLNS